MKTRELNEDLMAGVKVERAQRVKALPPYLFVEIDRLKRRMVEEGKDVINLGVGDPDLPTPKHVVQELYEAAKDSANQKYALDYGMPVLREAVAEWYQRRFQVKLDPATEVLPLIGSKEGIAHIPLAFINPGDFVLVPEPGYPVYPSSTILCGGLPYYMPLLEKNGYLPDLREIDTQVAHHAKVMFLNYPNNPTGAVCESGFFDKVIRFAQEHNIIVCHDAAYTEMTFDGYQAPSFLQAKGAKEVGIEFHSLSKTYNMTGWRLGFAVGNRDVIAALSQVKSNIDSGVFQAIQLAGVAALRGPQDAVKENIKIYKERRDILVEGLNKLGWKVPKPFATFYVWVPVPPGFTSSELARLLLEKASIVTTPGNGFGRSGEGYIRMALTVPKERIREALARIERMHQEWK